MPTSFRIDLDHATVIGHADGTLGPRELATFVESYTAHADFRPEMNVLWNLQDARFLIEIEEVREFAEQISARGFRETPHRVAFVVKHELTRMLTRMFPHIGPEHVVDYRTFEDLAGALEWLGLPPDYEL